MIKKYASIFVAEWKDGGGLGSPRDWLDIFPSVAHYAGVMSMGAVLFIMAGALVNVVAHEVVMGAINVGMGQGLVMLIMFAYLWANFEVLKTL